MIGIGLGFAVNLTGLPIPAVIDDALDLMIRAALPAALFGLGGVLYRYKPEGDTGVIAMICVGVAAHPSGQRLGVGPATVADLSQEQMRGGGGSNGPPMASGDQQPTSSPTMYGRGAAGGGPVSHPDRPPRSLVPDRIGAGTIWLVG